ncbi:hypothetical protein ABBQ32_011270 [Trebouxia sp. C0010 RCD-2024]
MSSALAGRTFVPCRSTASRRVRPGKAFFSGAPVAAKLRSHGVGNRKVTSMNLEFDAVGGAYANALVEVAQENNSLDDVHADMDALQSLFKDNEQIKTFLFNPVMTAEKKRDVVKKIGKEAGLSKYTTNFLNLLIDKDRIQAIEEIIDAFEKTYCKLTDTQVAVLRSAVKLEQEQQFLIAKKLQELTGSKNIKLKPIIDDTLIAGFTVEYGSAQIDMSVKGQLESIANELQGSNVGAMSKA